MLKICRRCSLGFYPSHGNQALCASCKAGRPTELRAGTTRTFGLRECPVCFRRFLAVSANQRFCGQRCLHRGRRRDESKYTSPHHRGSRRRWVPIVATGMVRCRRGPHCGRAVLVDGEFLGGFIEPTEAWHLGHTDSETPWGPAPEHVACNVGAPSRLAAKARRG